MVTDPLPRAPDLRKQFDASDARPTLPLPPGEPLQAVTRSLATALAAEDSKAVHATGLAMLQLLADFYETTCPGLQVLGARPLTVAERHSFELFGDYTPATEVIRVWMRTAVLAKVTSHRGLLNTILHEYCHHLDVASFGIPETPHTRGFFGRVDDLYHLALATPPEARKPLVWIRRGSIWRIDWSRLRGKR